MYPRIVHIYGSLWVQSYGLMIAIGFATFLFFTHRSHIRVKEISSHDYVNGVFLSLLVGIAGGRLAYVLTALEEFYENPLEIFMPWDGGLVVSGAIIAVLIFAPLYLKRIACSLFPLLDLVALYAPLMQTISRFGCFLAGCCYGLPAAVSSWWTVTFTNPNGIAPCNIALHPAQLYVSFASFLIFALLVVMVSLVRVKRGVVLFLYLCLENCSRFLVDFWRGDRGELVAIGFTQPIVWLSQVQLLSVVFFIFSIIGLIYSLAKPGKAYLFRDYGSI